MKVVIIGGGPAGMMAGISAAQNGNEVIILEKMDMPGRKLLITGKGRCNITSSLDISEFISNVPGNGRFLYSCFERYTNKDIIELMKKHGVQVKEERGNRIFPVSDKSLDVLKAFREELKNLNVKIITNADVKKIVTEDYVLEDVNNEELHKNGKTDNENVCLEQNDKKGNEGLYTKQNESVSDEELRIKQNEKNNYKNLYTGQNKKMSNEGLYVKLNKKKQPLKRVVGVEYIKDNKKNIESADKVILATGGNSYQATGSTGDGYIMAKELGHTITKITPSLVPLVANNSKELEKNNRIIFNSKYGNSSKLCKELQGLSLKNVRIKIEDIQNINPIEDTLNSTVGEDTLNSKGKEAIQNSRTTKDIQNSKATLNSRVTEEIPNGKVIYEDFGEMLFTHFGVSGPTILSGSAHLLRYKNIDSLLKNGRIILNIDLKPALTMEKLDLRLVRDFEKNKNKSLKNSLNDLLPQKLINPIIALSKIDENKKINEITKQERGNIAKIIKNFVITIENFRPINEAIITSGGVDIKEINPKTMQSKLVDGLYFAGEIIDVDAYTGGFNLQIAYSTGYVSGLN